ncbi:Nitroreductase [Loktanella fryxellensis]|uniref:Nitroreductase n=1 Tax=Loktanella fryxellensis TaxID=245187 RepID=A0A1H8G5E7_9RHOB|nr:nitroreductase [Loktanella fryxellensis]SEN39246.1 Nitroreductase [Loktanella fryxellensis]
MTQTPLEALLAQRHSVRAYRPDPVPAADVAAILTAARRAPSGGNLQPGHFLALTGAPFAALKASLAEGIAVNRPPVAEYDYFPDPMPPQFKARQRAAGAALYAALGIAHRDVPGRRAQFARNYDFFDAPVGLVVTIERDMGKGCWMDLGMALMALWLAAEARGLASTGIGALAHYGDLVHAALDLPADRMVVCGIALGHADADAPVNATRTDRAAFEEFAELRGFDA